VTLEPACPDITYLRDVYSFESVHLAFVNFEVRHSTYAGFSSSLLWPKQYDLPLLHLQQTYRGFAGDPCWQILLLSFYFSWNQPQEAPEVGFITFAKKYRRALNPEVLEFEALVRSLQYKLSEGQVRA
jgi:hypothetical protein